jgi:putative nucleotidyltransferase with HDIG domain
MLKKIPVSQVRLGMFLQALEGPWMDHPFWKTRFVMSSSADLALLQHSVIKECWIDPGKGLDVLEIPVDDEVPPVPLTHRARAAQRPALLPRQRVTATTTAPEPSLEQRSFDDELKQAAAVCNRGRAAVMSMFSEARMGRTIDHQGCVALVEDISASVRRNPGALVSLARLKTQDDYSYMHSVAVCALMVALARQLGLDEDACRAAGLAGLLHDVGKALMPLEVLNKPGRLTDEEYTLMRTHAQRGHELLQQGEDVPPQALEVALHHHERFDGSGYPLGLTGASTGLFARMGAVCDVYDAITSNRPYKAGWDPAESIAQMASWKGHFDPAIFNAFVQSLGIYPTGSLVRLESGLLAVVVEQVPGAMVSPKVRVFFNTRNQLPVAPRLLDLSRPGVVDRIAGRESNAETRFAHLDSLWAEPAGVRRGKA